MHSAPSLSMKILKWKLRNYDFRYVYYKLIFTWQMMFVFQIFWNSNCPLALKYITTAVRLLLLLRLVLRHGNTVHQNKTMRQNKTLKHCWNQRTSFILGVGEEGLLHGFRRDDLVLVVTGWNGLGYLCDVLQCVNHRNVA